MDDGAFLLKIWERKMIRQFQRILYYYNFNKKLSFVIHHKVVLRLTNVGRKKMI